IGGSAGASPSRRDCFRRDRLDAHRRQPRTADLLLSRLGNRRHPQRGAVEAPEATVAKFEKAAVGLLLSFLRRRAETDGLPDLRLSLYPQRLEYFQRGSDLRVFLDLL